MLLAVLKGATVFLSASSFVILTASLIELWIQRYEEKDPDYRVAITVLKWLCIASWIVSAVLASNYVYRFFIGLAGSTRPGPETTAVVSLVSFIACYGFFTLIGVVLLYLLWQSDEPTTAEQERRRRMAQLRLEAERRRRARRWTRTRRSV